jgi:hypothetical protein
MSVSKEKLNVMPGANELIKGHEESLTGYSCPKCDKSLSDTGQESIKNQSKQIFTGDHSEWDHEPGLSWVETHECTNCKTKFWLMNGC